MNLEMVVLRIVHIVSGTFWVGSAVFFAVILEPRLRALGPEIQRPVMGALSCVLPIALGGSGAVTIVFGVVLALRVRPVDAWFDTGWGWAILIGFVTSIAAMSIGSTMGVLAKRMVALGKSFEKRPPNAAEVEQIQRLSSRLVLFARITAVLVIIAVAAMASARYV